METRSRENLMVSLRVEEKFSKDELYSFFTILEGKVELLFKTKVLKARSKRHPLFDLAHLVSIFQDKSWQSWQEPHFWRN